MGKMAIINHRGATVFTSDYPHRAIAPRGAAG
jgi:hypothetical protein